MVRALELEVPRRPLTVVHISGDFPDPIEPAKTPVIRSLVNLTSDTFDHLVFSINRQSPSLTGFTVRLVKGIGRPAIAVSNEQFGYGEALSYEAPARGLYHRHMLEQLGNTIAQMLDKRGMSPSVLVGHKLTIEGIAVASMARKHKLPFVVCIQGNTDLKILSARPDLRSQFGQIFHDAAVVFAFAPWALKHFETLFGARLAPTYLLPCVTELDQPLVPSSGSRGLVSVFHLKNYKTKNLEGMVNALALLKKKGLNAQLDIHGGGSPNDFDQCQKLIGTQSNVNLLGPVSRDELPTRLNSATGFVMPSIRESFGLVFIEALFAGLPIIYPKGGAVDGYFEGLPFAIGVDSRDPASIAAAMRLMIEEEISLKAALREWQLSEASRRFQRQSIAAVFASGLNRASKMTPAS